MVGPNSPARLSCSGSAAGQTGTVHAGSVLLGHKGWKLHANRQRHANRRKRGRTDAGQARSLRPQASEGKQVLLSKNSLLLPRLGCQLGAEASRAREQRPSSHYARPKSAVLSGGKCTSRGVLHINGSRTLQNWHRAPKHDVAWSSVVDGPGLLHQDRLQGGEGEVRGRVEVRSEQLDKDTPLASRTMAALPLLPLE